MGSVSYVCHHPEITNTLVTCSNASLNVRRTLGSGLGGGVYNILHYILCKSGTADACHSEL